MNRFKRIFGLISVCMLASGCTSKEPDAANKLTMTPATTYLYLLQDTPFFSDLSDKQLSFVIQHSKEYETEKGAVISQCDAQQHQTDYWILLDGRWALQYQGRDFPNGNTGPGKWYSPLFGPKENCQLIMLEHGYVMKLSEIFINEMLNQGFNFKSNLDSGKAHYQRLGL